MDCLTPYMRDIQTKIYYQQLINITKKHKASGMLDGMVFVLQPGNLKVVLMMAYNGFVKHWESRKAIHYSL